ncbi:MAG: tetratricopeptide repeat protein [Candidatus Eisenbacteria bacterium]|uniref:Tetratricopeptide repeat protein n=1 Tax=Eiseniibacteriota bacterium TaxID=2212470 RepID=A0A538TCA1_UNCEI|nr:MAG: tetratricopeptide repeat protein [Candidatus Eisenbacteria bacterium]
MSEILARAAALRDLVRGDSATSHSRPLAEAVLACCEELVAAGEFTPALELVAKTLSLRSLPEEWVMRLELVRATALRVAGQYEAALEKVRAIARDHSGILETEKPERHRLQISEAACLWRMNRVDEAVERLSSLRAELLTRPDSSLLASCTLELSSAEIFRGRHSVARGFVLEAIVSARRSGNKFVEAIALDNLGRLERSLCRWASALEAGQEALRILEGNGNRVQANVTRRVLGILLWKQGRLDIAQETIDACLREARAIGHTTNEEYTLLLAGLVALHRGDHEQARLAFQATGRPDPLSRPSLLAYEYVGDEYLERGRAEDALEHYDLVWPMALALVPKGDIVAELRRRRAEAMYLLGRHDEAHTEAEAALAHCRELGDRYEEAATYRVLALSAAAVGRAAEAKKWFEQGFAFYDDIETP